MKAILFVRSVRTATGTRVTGYVRYAVQTMGSYGSFSVPAKVIPDYLVSKEADYENILPEDQKAVVEMVKKAAVRHDFELTVIDVTDEGALDKLKDKLMGISTFPTLLTDSGVKIERDITEERIEALFTKQNTKSRAKTPHH